MGLFDRVEKRIEGAVNGVFARAFRGDVHPVEIAARLQRELDSEARLLSRDKRIVPNNFVVGLSPHDHDRLVPYAKTINAEIVPELRDHAADRRYVFNGPISIAYELDESLPTGRFTVSSEAVDVPESRGDRASERREPAQPGAPRQNALVLEVNGVRHPLTPPGLLVGRGSEADLRINDPGISRRHAMIHVEPNPQAGPGDDTVRVHIEDLGSTNGIIVNGQKVRAAALLDGTRLEIGSTRMLVHSPVGS